MEDPRLTQRIDFDRLYNQAIENQEYPAALVILDQWEELYSSVEGYYDSFEVGVLYNNRSSIYIIEFEEEILLSDSKDFKPTYRYLDLAEEQITLSIGWYEKWLQRYGSYSHQQFVEHVALLFDENDDAFTGHNLEKIRLKRVENLELAQIETVRRLSVSLTNLGVIQRYRNKLDEAKKTYEKAIKLWDMNYTAIDNLEILMGRKPQKRNIIDKLFPPEKDS